MLERKKLILIGGGVIVALLVIVIVAFTLTRPEPEKPVILEQPLLVEDVLPQATTAPEPTSWSFPLTGLETQDKEATLHRTFSVKIENSPDARPQTGISSADVVYETVTEGGITRLNCLFQSNIPPELGPVRSARLSDLFIVPQYDALLFFSGANPYIEDQIASAGLDNMSHSAASSLYYRVDYREMPHNLYVNLADAYTLASEKGFATTVETPQGLAFANATNSATRPEQTTLPDALNITVPFSPSYIAEWSWDETSGTYLRSMDDASIDAATDEQIATTNLVVLWASYVTSQDNLTFYVDLGETGPAAIFIDGKRIDGTWEGSKTAPPHFKDKNGNPILLAPGKTWFQVLDVSLDVTVSD
jgi:hypothetical protein